MESTLFAITNSKSYIRQEIITSFYFNFPDIQKKTIISKRLCKQQNIVIKLQAVRMASRIQGSRGVARVLSKLNTSLENGNYYEAHQMYRTLYYRYSAQSKWADLETMLYEGAVKLFNHGQGGSGADLAKLYLEILEKAEIKPTEEIMKKVGNLYQLTPTHLPDKDNFKVLALKWSLADKKHPNGHPRLHQLFAYTLWRSKKYTESRQHFLHSMDGSGCGTMLAEFHVNNGFPREMDLFIVGTVLQMLCLRKHIVAALTLKSYTESHPSLQPGPPYKHPLLNFVWLLLLAIEHKQSVTAYSILVEKYTPCLKRDPSYLEYLDKIGQYFFGLAPPPKARPGGMFSGLFDSLLNVINDDGGEDSSEDDNDALPSPSTSRNSSSKVTKTKMMTEDLD